MLYNQGHTHKSGHMQTLQAKYQQSKQICKASKNAKQAKYAKQAIFK